MSKHLTRKPAGPFHWDGHDPDVKADAARTMLAALHKMVNAIQAAHNDTGNTIGHIVTGAEAMETGRAAITIAQIAGIVPAIPETGSDEYEDMKRAQQDWDIDGLAK